MIDGLILVAWLVLVGYQVVHHAMWRDEVRALSIALHGNDFIAMLKGLHGEGHPAIWYLLLRGAYAFTCRVEVLAATAFLVGFATVTLLIFRSPFPRPLVGLLVTGHAFLFEYSVMARNYGIAALLFFLLALAYPRHRDRGVVLGILLFLLANTNVVAAILTAPFLLFWLLDILKQTRWRWSPKLKNFALNSAITMVGVALCAVTILPTYNDAQAHDWSASSPVVAAFAAIINPGGTSQGALFAYLLPGFIGSALLFASALGLWPRWPAVIAAVCGLVLCALFYGVAAAGAYRHAGMWLCFIIALYWICWPELTTGDRLAWRPSSSMIAWGGRIAFLVIAAVQTAAGLNDLRVALTPGMVASRSADFGRLMASRPDLANAVIVTEPEYLAEALPYYVKNPTYLVREHAFGNVIKFSRHGRLESDLGETLAVSRDLQRSMGVPVLILLSYRLDQITPGLTYEEGERWRTFRASAEQIREFAQATTMIKRFAPARTNESFDVYLLGTEKPASES
ncbi:hypothetical protein [Bradyrhizobium guangzhouense]|uniref:hypothetical protein n=1 Tax=Bradyrhizobium guangzhouense TaxID=1325095 RepID=UPI001FE23870|nr:hypothetical protein [Bradyrhizobium guangzhouense]